MAPVPNDEPDPHSIRATAQAHYHALHPSMAPTPAPVVTPATISLSFQVLQLDASSPESVKISLQIIQASLAIMNEYLSLPETREVLPHIAVEPVLHQTILLPTHAGIRTVVNQ